jgi:hypothetical protein
MEVRATKLKGTTKIAGHGILNPMSSHHIPWEWLIFGLVKLLKVFGIIPGAIAAFGVRKLYQRWRQNKAIAGWPATDATIQSGTVHKEGWRVWVELTYTYFVSEYRSGTYVHKLRSEEQAEEFLRQVKDKHVLVHYNGSNPEKSVILDRDLELVALLTPSYR